MSHKNLKKLRRSNIFEFQSGRGREKPTTNGFYLVSCRRQRRFRLTFEDKRNAYIATVDHRVRIDRPREAEINFLQPTLGS